MACALIQLITSVTEVVLPYSLQQTPLGFTICDSSGAHYPLYLLIEAPLSTEADPRNNRALGDSALYMQAKIKQTVRFEQGVVLLDQDIQYLLFNFRV